MNTLKSPSTTEKFAVLPDNSNTPQSPADSALKVDTDASPAFNAIPRPAPVSYLIPQIRPFTDTELNLMAGFIDQLPVSVELTASNYQFLHRLIAPLFVSGVEEVVIDPATVTTRMHEEFRKCETEWTLEQSNTIIERIFAATKVLIIGQLEVERDPVNNALRLRVNRDNAIRLFDYMDAELKGGLG